MNNSLGMCLCVSDAQHSITLTLTLTKLCVLAFLLNYSGVLSCPKKGAVESVGVLDSVCGSRMVTIAALFREWGSHSSPDPA